MHQILACECLLSHQASRHQDESDRNKDSPKTVEVENIGNASLQFSSLTYATDFPEGTLNNDCTASTSLGTASTC